ncbi:DUF3653 domain-containing protein [uncultured Amphritea sp.]|uniref:DUF3653 domain-containing protein n=1 Tax=uncultured Amphritea sp. TaxID=981605 RepID=UPI002605B650|nr:DUF3653 domain-containing protein [uncultured Amphritea sp.]
MIKNQDELTGFFMKNSRRYVQSKKLNLESLGLPGRYLTASEVSDLGLVSRAHAYKIIADPERFLSAQVKELLIIKVLGQIPGWQPGWRFDSAQQRIHTPDGKSLSCEELENFAFVQQLLSLWEVENRDQAQQLERQKQRIEELENRLKLPPKLRLYVNDSLKQRRKLDIEQPALKAV